MDAPLISRYCENPRLQSDVTFTKPTGAHHDHHAIQAASCFARRHPEKVFAHALGFRQHQGAGGGGPRTANRGAVISDLKANGVMMWGTPFVMLRRWSPLMLRRDQRRSTSFFRQSGARIWAGQVTRTCGFRQTPLEFVESRVTSVAQQLDQPRSSSRGRIAGAITRIALALLPTLGDFVLPSAALKGL